MSFMLELKPQVILSALLKCREAYLLYISCESTPHCLLPIHVTLHVYFYSDLWGDKRISMFEMCRSEDKKRSRLNISAGSSTSPKKHLWTDHIPPNTCQFRNGTYHLVVNRRKICKKQLWLLWCFQRNEINFAREDFGVVQVSGKQRFPTWKALIVYR